MPPTGTRRDPLTVFSFRLSLKAAGDTKAEPSTAFFKSVTGIKAEMETADLKIGGENYYMWKMPGALKWPNLVFKKGFTGDVTFFMGLLNGTDVGNGMTRWSGVIEHLAPGNVVKARWSFNGGILAKWDCGDLDASKNELAIETFEIAHHGLFFKASA